MSADDMRKDMGFAFLSDLDLPRQLERLNAQGPLVWVERESAWYGDYLSTRAHEDYAFFKIYDDGEGRYVLNIKFVSERPGFEAEFEALKALARERVLPVLDARDVAETEPYD